MTEADFKSAGEKLASRRKELRISLETAKRRTKIPMRYLLALEAGDGSPFPAQLYRQSFLLEYSEYLGISQSIRRETTPDKPSQPAAAQTTDEPRQHDEKKHIFLADAEPFEQENMPLETREAVVRLAVALAVGSIFISIWTWRNASDKNWARNFERARKSDRVYENFFISHLSAETSRKTWARVDSDGETLYEGYMPAGARKRWSAARNFMIKVSDPAGTRFLLDNRPIPPGVFKASTPVNIPVTFSGFAQTQ